MDLLYFSLIDWNATWQRPQQLASRFANLGKLLYIGPLGMRAPSWRDIPRLGNRIRFRMQKQAQTTAPDFHSPLMFLPFPNSKAASRWNAASLRSALRRWMKRASVSSPAVWINYPSTTALRALEGLDIKLLVYDCIDEYQLFHANAKLRDAEMELAGRADLVFATAHTLHERMKSLNPHSYLMPNAADYDFISGAISTAPEIHNLKRPILGYIGELADWFDYDLIRSLASQHPEWTFVLAGPQHSSAVNELSRTSNIHLPGRIPYSQVPAFLSAFDVCLIPFRKTPLTAAVNPVKLYEYLASGKPVVSTDLAEVQPFRNLIEVADPASFAQGIARALSSTADIASKERRLAAARANTWDLRVREILSLMSNNR